MHFPSSGGNCIVADETGSVVSDHPNAALLQPSASRALGRGGSWEDSVVDRYMHTLQTSLEADDPPRHISTVSTSRPQHTMQLHQPLSASRGPLGELIIVRSGAGRFGRGVGDLRLCPTPPEVAALNNEVDRLMTYCDVIRREHQREHDERKQQHAEALEKARDDHLAESKLRREEYTAASMRLQEENSSLRARIAVLEEETNSKALEAEKASLHRKLVEVEKAWASLLSSKEQQWAEDCRSLRDSRDKLDSQHKLLRDAVVDLEGALRRLVTEKERLEEIVLAEPQRLEQSSSALSHDLAVARQALADAREQVGTLQSRVDLLEQDALGRERAFEEKTLDLQREVENERQRNNGVVAMYVKQVESLHQQLTNAMSKNRILVAELQKERSRHVLDR